MSTMIRKQVYIEPRQDELLKQWVEETGKTEAQIFREALDHWMTNEKRRQDAQIAWQQIMAFVEQRMAEGPVPGGRTWTREELSEERLNRYGHRPD